MTVWFVFALIATAAIFAVLWPLARGHDTEAGSEFEVYRDQLDKIERDRAAGLIGEAETEAARAEVSRRLIAAADVAEFRHSVPIGSPLWRRRAALMAGFVLLPIGATAICLVLGSPQLTGEPLTGRMSAAQQDRVARLADHLKENGNDIEGWQRLLHLYKVAGERNKAHAAAADARRALASDPDKIRRIEDMIRTLGLEG
jgi:cytochrome c-type biogenesis protein CcmH